MIDLIILWIGEFCLEKEVLEVWIKLDFIIWKVYLRVIIKIGGNDFFLRKRVLINKCYFLLINVCYIRNDLFIY